MIMYLFIIVLKDQYQLNNVIIIIFEILNKNKSLKVF